MNPLPKANDVVVTCDDLHQWYERCKRLVGLQLALAELPESDLREDLSDAIQSQLQYRPFQGSEMEEVKSIQQIRALQTCIDELRLELEEALTQFRHVSAKHEALEQRVLNNEYRKGWWK